MSNEYRVERKGLSPSEIGDLMANKNQPSSSPPASSPHVPPDFKGVEIKGVPPHLRKQLGEASEMPSKFPPHMEQPQRSAPQPIPQIPRPQLGPVDPEYQRLIEVLDGHRTKYEEIMLPSKGKFYDNTNGPGNGILHVRAMTGNEEQILATPRYVKKGKALDMIFRECIAEKQYDPAKLLTVDRTFLLIYLRGISYTSDYDVEVKCPHCGTGFTTVIDLNLPIEQCPDDFSADDLEGVLPTSGFKFTYRLSTGADENLVTEHREKRVKDWGDQAADDTLTFRASLLVTSIEGVHSQPMIQALLQRLPINDVAHIRNLVNDPPFGVKTEVKIICPNCSEDFEVDMPLEAHFFFPRRKKEKRKN